jgi:signal transduction histidine kinase
VEAAFNLETFGEGGTAPADATGADIASAAVASSTTAPFPTDGEQLPGGIDNVTGRSDVRSEERDYVRLSVQDIGIGIPARDLDRIFERFYRVDHGRSRDTGGTGLGLSIVRHVANNHQGWVDVESREGEGSTFSLVLPLHTDRLV